MFYCTLVALLGYESLLFCCHCPLFRRSTWRLSFSQTFIAVERREDRPDERIRGGNVYACRSDFLRSGPSLFFCRPTIFPRCLSILSSLFVSSLFIPRPNLRSQLFFLFDPFPSLSLSSERSLPHSLSSLAVPYLHTKGMARGTRHIISLITPGDLF